MDPVAIAEIWKQGVVVTLLLVAVLWFAWRDHRNEVRAEKRDKDCTDRNAVLGERIDTLHSQFVGEYRAVADRTTAALIASTTAIRRTLGDTVTPPDPLPTLHIHHPSDQR